MRVTWINDAYPTAWEHLEQFIAATFPALRGIRVDYRWGGAFSVTSNSTPQIGTLDGGRAVYSIGCTGHGVAMTHMNGRIIRDLVLGRKTELTDLWFVNRRLVPDAARTAAFACRQNGDDRHEARRLVVRSR